MTSDLVSLAIIALTAAASPIVAKIIPNKLVPETVFLLIAGALMGCVTAVLLRAVLPALGRVAGTVGYSDERHSGKDD